MLLYCTKEEAVDILASAEELKITGENYVWVVTQSVIENAQAHPTFPIGMLGVHFDTSSGSLINEISTALKVYAMGVQSFQNDPTNVNRSLNTQQLSCEEEGKSRWDNGEMYVATTAHFHKDLFNHFFCVDSSVICVTYHSKEMPTNQILNSLLMEI